MRLQAVAGGHRACSCIVRVRLSYSCIVCTHVTKALSYTLPDRSRPRQRRSSAAIRLQQSHNTMDVCTPPAHSERLARDRAGAGRPAYMRRRTLRPLRPRPRHLQPARRPLRADPHCCSLGDFAPRSAPPEPPRAPPQPLLPSNCSALLLPCSMPRNGYL